MKKLGNETRNDYWGSTLLPNEFYLTEAITFSMNQ
jgi:hypothetical protein